MGNPPPFYLWLEIPVCPVVFFWSTLSAFAHTSRRRERHRIVPLFIRGDDQGAQHDGSNFVATKEASTGRDVISSEHLQSLQSISC
jgi:hypothetical protein